MLCYVHRILAQHVSWDQRWNVLARKRRAQFNEAAKGAVQVIMSAVMLGDQFARSAFFVLLLSGDQGSLQLF